MVPNVDAVAEVSLLSMTSLLELFADCDELAVAEGHNDQKERDCGFLTLIDLSVSESESTDWNKKKKLVKLVLSNRLIDIKDVWSTIFVENKTFQKSLQERDCGFLTLIDPAVSESESTEWIYVRRKKLVIVW